MLTDSLNNLTIFPFITLIVVIVEKKESIKIESPNNSQVVYSLEKSRKPRILKNFVFTLKN